MSRAVSQQKSEKEVRKFLELSFSVPFL